MPVSLTVHPDGQVTPPTVSIPAHLSMQLRVTNRTGAPVTVSMEGVTGALEVEPGKSATRRVDGRPKGRYEVRVSGAGTATVVTGVPPGP